MEIKDAPQINNSENGELVLILNWVDLISKWKTTTTTTTTTTTELNGSNDLFTERIRIGENDSSL